jgi:uncharacterized protein with HEPN domain
MVRRVLPALADILATIAEIENTIAGKVFKQYQADWLLQRGIERAIEIISEASRKIPPEMRAKHPEIPWRDVATIGNLLRHEYHSISSKIIWAVVQEDLPALKNAVVAMRGSLEGQDPD